MTTDQTPAIGHNRPTALTPELILDTLSEEHAELLSDVERLSERSEDLPSQITSDDDLAPVSDHIKELGACLKTIEAQRKNEKAPYRAAASAVDGFFQSMAAGLSKSQKALKTAAGAYLRAKEDEARRKRQAEEREAQERAREAMRKAEQAERGNRAAEAEARLDAAARADEDARKAEKAANVKSAELARARTQKGSVSTLREVKVFEITDYDQIDLNRLRPYFKRDQIEQAIRSFMNSGRDDLPGVQFRVEKQAVIR